MHLAFPHFGLEENKRKIRVKNIGRAEAILVYFDMSQCEFWHGALTSVEGSPVVLNMPRLQHTACLGVRVCIDLRGLGEIDLVVG